MKKKLFAITVIIVFFLNLSIAFCDNNPIAIIKHFSGDIIIKSPLVTAQNYLLLYDGMIIETNNNGELKLYFKNGVEKFFAGNLKFKIVNKNTINENFLVEPLNNVTKKYLATTTSKSFYYVEQIAGTMGIDNMELNIPLKLEQKINAIEKNIENKLFKALLKGECYRNNGYEILAINEFKIHYRLLYQQHRIDED